MSRACEVCAEKGVNSVANRELEGVWMCVDCIVKVNTEKILRQNASSGQSVSRATNQVPSLARAEGEHPTPKGTIVGKPPIANAQALVAVLSTVMEKMLAGDLEPDKAVAICKVSGEALKALDLIWRMGRQ